MKFQHENEGNKKIKRAFAIKPYSAMSLDECMAIFTNNSYITVIIIYRENYV